MDIYEVPHNDHRVIENLLNDLMKLKDNDEYRHVIIQEIRNNLIPHARAEESVFYNTLQAVNADKKLVFHGYQVHLEAQTLLRTLQVMNKMSLGRKAVAEKLPKVILHYLKKDESEIFT